jgi:3-oxoacyl-[acyl-carrier protein] reductase
LVNNAGIAEELGMLHEVTDEVWPSVVETHLAILNTHVNGTFYCTREALRRMSGRRAGTIINMGALAGLRGGPGVASYSAAKGAIHAFTKAVAHDVAGLGIRVNCIAPGFVETPLLSQFPEQLRWLVIQLTALGRFGNPEEIAAVALFLASEESSFIIGQVISPNGGLYF